MSPPRYRATDCVPIVILRLNFALRSSHSRRTATGFHPETRCQRPGGEGAAGGYRRRRGHSMTRRVRLALPRASLVTLLSTLAIIWIDPAHAAGECSAAPRGAAPQGSHWYYRVDRAKQRKCWYLAAQGQKTYNVAPKLSRAHFLRASTPSPRVETNSEPSAPDDSPLPVTEVRPVELRATLTERPASLAERFEMPAPRAPPAVPDIVQDEVRPPVPEQSATPQPDMIESKLSQTPAPAGIGAFQIGLMALAAMLLLASAILYLARARRARAQDDIIDLNKKAPLRRPDAMGIAAAQVPARTVDHHNDEAMEERLRQFAQAWRRQAA